MTPQAWEAWLEEKGDLLEVIDKWKRAALLYRDASNAWEAEAMRLRRQSAEYRDMCARLKETVEGLLPEKAIETRARY
jgi:hypothetical protein